jgi:hypothetical protein
VRAHLLTCEGCSREWRRVSNAAAPDGGAADRGLLAGILAGIESWESAPSRTEDVKARVGSAIASFLGPHATDELLGAVSAQGDNLFSTLEPVVALFLGCRAASALVDHLVARSIPRAL